MRLKLHGEIKIFPERPKNYILLKVLPGSSFAAKVDIAFSTLDRMESKRGIRLPLEMKQIVELRNKIQDVK